jgi:LacI family transcriptional regulator
MTRVTIADVARHARVSTSAVSKVLRDAYGVSAGMRARVLTAIDELGYRPHAAARALRGHASALGVLLPDLRDPSCSDLVDGIAEELDGTGFELLICRSGHGRAVESRALRALADQPVGGVVLVAPLSPRAELEAVARTVPVVVLGRPDRSPRYDAVFGDDETGARLVVEHLAGLGHRRIAHLAHRDTDARARAYERAMTDLGLGGQARVVRTAGTEAGGAGGVAELLTGPDPPTAVFAGTDLAAIGALAALREAGMAVPESVSVAGYGNGWPAALGPVSLTSVDPSSLTLGRTAGRLLRERIGGRTASARISITPALVRRRTTARAP